MNGGPSWRGAFTAWLSNSHKPLLSPLFSVGEPKYLDLLAWDQLGRRLPGRLGLRGEWAPRYSIAYCTSTPGVKGRGQAGTLSKGAIHILAMSAPGEFQISWEARSSGFYVNF